MDKKWILSLIVLCTFFLTISSVSADEMNYQDFDNYFSMKAPNNIHFEKEINKTSENGIDQLYAAYISENVVVMYINSLAFSNESAVFFYQSFFEQMNPGSMECYESQEDNLTILEPVTNDGSGLSLVGMSSGNQVLIVAGDDLYTIKAMARTAKFN